ncbi:MAG: hypothetical protein PHC50_00125 [Candidatus Cloacimonetes bacterium]|nr:hypothetical protein [Candidatus Cloacimonadota bacterium]
MSYEQIEISLIEEVSRRKHNIIRSPKQGGSACRDSYRYLAELGISIIDDMQPIQYTGNMKQLVHRWAPYVQGFSSEFVQSMIEKYRKHYKNLVILDPFSGCGTVPVQAKLNGFESYGVEINPLMHFINQVKLNSWSIDPNRFLQEYQRLNYSILADYPTFLKTEKQFDSDVLDSLCRIKGAIESHYACCEDKKIYDLLRVAFCSILIDSSNLKRSPCLGYSKKNISALTPYKLFDVKIKEIIEDLRILQSEYPAQINTRSQVVQANSMHHDYPLQFNLAITSPPYMNGMDYIMNYKIEMAWLGFAENQKTLSKLKNDMVVCDNVSKQLIAEHKNLYSNKWIEDIKESIARRIKERGSYRRPDMPDIVHKYFDDMYQVFTKVVPALKQNGRFILVIGDSLIADTYIPTDLILAKIGQDLGMSIESVVKARNRRSGQIRSYKLRETIITLIKE